MNREPRASASRLAAVGAALSLASASIGLAADPAGAPGAPGGLPARTEPSKAASSPPARPSPRPPGKSPPVAAEESAVDDDLIEFLGSIGDTTEDGDWLDFLTSTDIDKVAKRGSKTPPRDR